MQELENFKSLMPGAGTSPVGAYQQAWDQITPYALATIVRIVGPAATSVGAKVIITHDGEIVGAIGGACLRGALKKAAKTALASGEPQLIRTVPKDEVHGSDEGIPLFPTSCPSKGMVDLFVEPVLPKTVLTVFGETELADAICALGAAMGFRTIRPSPADATGADQTGADQTGADETGRDETGPDKIGPAAGGGTSGRVNGYVVVATQGVRDRAALEAALKSDALQVFFVASRKKADHWRRTLGDSGMKTEALDKLISPAGLPIGARSANEIALSVIAQVVMMKNKRSSNSSAAQVKANA